MRVILWSGFFLIGLSLSFLGGRSLRASDHDDGEVDGKSKSVNLTDLYAFREDWHTNASADDDSLILVMNSNPRSLPGQQYYFSTRARYEFHVKRAAEITEVYSTGEDVLLRFTFGEPDSDKEQRIYITAVRDGAVLSSDLTTSGGAILTTPLGAANTNSQVTLGDHTLTVFAGLKEDPAFFDIETFFNFRKSIIDSDGASLGDGLEAAASAKDFAAGHNVNAIVVRVPIEFLQADDEDDVFDVWATTSTEPL